MLIFILYHLSYFFNYMIFIYFFLKQNSKIKHQTPKMAKSKTSQSKAKPNGDQN